MNLTETIPIIDVYADGVAMVERLGPNERITLYTLQTAADMSRVERVIVARIVCPAGQLRMPAPRDAN